MIFHCDSLIRRWNDPHHDMVFWNAALWCVELNDTCGNNANYYMHIFTTNHKITARITLYTYYARMNRDALSIVNFFRTFLCEYTPINYEWCVVSFYVHLINSDFKYTKACVGIFAFFDFFLFIHGCSSPALTHFQLYCIDFFLSLAHSYFSSLTIPLQLQVSALQLT